MLILVTGGCGYIGSQTIVELVKEGHTIISIDDYRNSKKGVLDQLKLITDKYITNFDIDVSNHEDVENVFMNYKIDAVIHFAADKSVDESIKKPIKYFYNNVNSLNVILDLCNKYDVKKIIFSSSASVYGDECTYPVSEDSSSYKDSESYPISPYGMSKKMGEEILEASCNLIDIKGISLRYFNPVGSDSTYLIGEDNDNPQNLVPILCQVASGKREILNIYGNDYLTDDGTCVRDYIHIVDLARAHIKALEYNVDKYEVFNIGTGTGYSVLEMVKTFERVNDIKINYKFVDRREGDVNKIYSDITKMENELKFKCEHDLSSMLKSSWKWELSKLKR